MKIFEETFDYLNTNRRLLFIIIPAAILTLIPFIFDGQHGCIEDKCGFIIGTNHRDGIWFQAIAATSFKTFLFQMPNFAGELLRGYHYLPNLATYLLSLVGIPISVTYYKIIPIVYFTLLTILIIQLGKKIINKPLFVGILLFFTYFGMHLSLITSLYHVGEIRNQVLINTFQATRILESPHTAIALVIMFFVVILLYRKKIDLKSKSIISLLMFLSFGIKFYVAFSIMSILFVYEIILLIQKKDIKNYLISNSIYAVGAIAAILLFYDPLSLSQSGSTFVFSPFATVHHLIESPDLFYSQQMVLARYYLHEHGWSPRLVVIELFSIFLFVLFYFGTRIIGFFQIIFQAFKQKVDAIEVAITVSIILSLIAATMFIQKGDWFNPIQFAVPAAFLMNIFAAKFLYGVIQSNKIVGTILLVFIVLITFPANLSNFTYLTNLSRVVVPDDELEALSYLRKQPDGIVHAPIEGDDMAYVSFFTRKQTYVNFVSVLENSGIDYEYRIQQSPDEVDDI